MSEDLDVVKGWVIVKEEKENKKMIKPVYDDDLDVYEKVGLGAEFFNYKRTAELIAKSLNELYKGDAKFFVVKARIVKGW